MEVLLLQAAMAGPTAAAFVWLLLIRWAVVRRVAAALVALASIGAASMTFWFAYRGDPPVWRSFAPGLLGATVVVAAELAVLLVALRADTVRRALGAATVVSLGVATTAVVAGGYTESLPVHSLLLPVPTLAAAVAALSGRGRRDAKGLLGLAVADAVALVGLSVVYARTETASIAPTTGLGVGLVLGAAAAKAGALPGVATWRLAATGGPGSLLAVALRGQAVVLAVVAGVVMARGERILPLAVAAAAAMFVAGMISVVVRMASSSVAAVTGTAFGLPFLALGLGGTLGIRAFLLLSPALLLAAGVTVLLAAPAPEEEAPAEAATAEPSGGADRPGRAAWAWLATASLGVAVGSLLGAPPGGGFPGTWLSLSLATARSEATPGWLLIAAGAGVGLALALFSVPGLIRSARARPVAATCGAVVSVGLLYAGLQPVRLGVGWWIRIESSLRLPEVLPAAGAPTLPAVGGLNLLLVAAAPLGIALVVVGLGLGLREPDRGWIPHGGPPRTGRAPGRVRRFPARATLRPVVRAVEQLGRMGVGLALAAAFEVAALLVAGRLVLLAARAGFL